tara:strand:- start:1787 stop:5443 length:3657 start_codon:yes stop_codon:yes gene_type:complete
MRPLTTNKLVLKRLVDDWKLLLSIFVGIVIATSLVAGAPIYIRTLERQGLDTAIDRSEQRFLNVYTVAPYTTLSRSGLEESEAVIDRALSDNISEIYRNRERYIKTATYLVGTQGRNITLGSDGFVSRGYFQYLSNLADHVTFLEGRMATDKIEQGPDGPVIEGILGRISSSAFDLQVGDVAVLAPSVADTIKVTVRIVGVLEVTDPEEEYWHLNPNIFFAPEPLTETPDVGVDIDPEEIPLSLFTSYEAMIEGVGASYPGSMVNSTWFTFIDKNALKDWSKSEARSRLDQLEADVSEQFRGSAVFTGIDRLLTKLERRSFFTSVPLLLLLVVMVVTVLYYISMMVSYLVSNRDSDVALLRSRGVSTWQLTRLYAYEGLILTSVATIIAPFIAMGTISMAGKLGYFETITLGARLPVAFTWLPFAVAAGTGLLCLATFVAPGVIVARTGLVVHKLRSSRPPSTPIFQRYHLDVGLLVFGGLIFWELYSRGQVVSRGLFSDATVNEALLFAPVLLLTVVALLFMRFFPLMVRYLSGDSPALMHMLAIAILVAMACVMGVRGLRADAGYGWLWDFAIVGGVSVAYLGANRSPSTWNRAAGLVVQTGLVALFIYSGMPGRDDVLFIPAIALALLVPAQLIFLATHNLARVYPVWTSMAIWHMSRNPLQYSWLVLLLVMVTGLAVLATTVGGTLDRSYEERVLYEVGADLRVTGVPSYYTRTIDDFKEMYLEIPGVTALSVALRGGGSVGSNYSGSSFRMLALESEDFPYISWYRNDFSRQPLSGIMRSLQGSTRSQPIDIPEAATSLRVWAQPEEAYANMFLWMVVRDRKGILDTLSLGSVGEAEWHVMEVDIPTALARPLSLVSVQLYEPVFGPAGTVGSILLDDIQAVFDNGTEAVVLDDFEGPNKWITLATSLISSDSVGTTREAPRNGQRAGVFSFGKDTDAGIRGFYRSPSGGAVPVVTSSTFSKISGARIGDEIIVNIFGRMVPIKIMDTVDFFPTLDPAQSGFLLADLDNMLGHLNLLSPTTIIRPNELFIAEVPGAADAVYQTALRLAGSRDLVLDRATMLEDLQLDPLITAGWKAMVLLAAGIVVFSASMGYITYLLSFSSQSRSEMGFLQALGVTKRQMGWLLGAEHLVIVAIGLIIGTATGFAMSNIMVSGVAVTETGEKILPPFILTTQWSLLGPIFVIMLAVFGAALYWLSRMVTNVDLHEISRMEDE